MACKEWAAKIGGGALGRVWAIVAAFALLLGLAAMAPTSAQAASFRDVPSGQWYTSWVDQASDQGLMSGFTDPATGRPTGYFGPDEPLTRAQVATVLWRMAGGPSSGHASFPDVERGSWYDAPVAWCVKAGVVTGYTSGPDRGYFRPDRPVTRQELATMVHRYAKYAGMDVADPDPSAFRSTTDWRTVDSWASEALTWTAAAGVLSGVDNHDGTYSVVPFGTATRAMAAKVFVVLSGSPSAAKASYTVTFDSNGGSAVKAQTVKNGAKAAKPSDPAKEGYEFAGWYSDKSLTKAFNFHSTVKSNLTLYAKWEAKAQAYAILYKDGLLSLQAGPDTDPSHGEVLGKWAWDVSSRPWYDKRARVRSVVVRDEIAISDESRIFGGLLNCKSMDLSKLDVSRATSFCSMFWGCSSLQSLDVSRWDVSSATNLSSMFYNCSSLQSLDLSDWDVSCTTTFGGHTASSDGMFSGCSALKSLDLSDWDVSSAKDMSQLFFGCSALESLDLSNWDVSSATDLSNMFGCCFSLKFLDLSSWDVSSTTDLSWMFQDCVSLISLDLSSWDLSSTVNLSSMFSGCSSLQSLDVSGWDVSSVSDFSNMFFDCSALNTVTFGAGCGPLVGKLPSGPWYDAEGKGYDRPPAGVAGTFTKTKPAMLALTADGVSDADALLPAQVVEGEQDGQRYVVVPEGAPFECGLEYPELAGRYVGPGVYVTGYVGDADSVTVPLEIDGAPVVSVNLSWNDSDRADMMRLSFVSFERAEGKVSSLAQLDVSGNVLSSLDIEGLGALVRLNCEGNPIADLVALQAWAAQDGHEAKLPQVQDAAAAEPDDVAAPSDSQEPTSPDIPAEPASPEAPSTEPGEPSVPATPIEPEQPGSSDVSGEPDQSGDDSVGSGMGESDEQEEPADTAGLGEAGQDGDASTAEEQASTAELAEPGEEPFALAA